MSARPIANGTIAFGLVSIPVRLFSAAAPSSAIQFNYIHKPTGSRVRQQYVLPESGAVVPRDELVRGYEFAKDRYVTFTSEELKAVEAQSTGAIDIDRFVPFDSVDPIYFERGYYLGPDKGAARAYALLAEALRRTGLCAVGNYAARGKSYLVMLRPVDKGLVMYQLHHQYEVRTFDEVPVEETKLKETEVDLAIQLVRQAADETFDPGRYHDEVRERVEAMIQRKVEGEDITAVSSETPKAQVIDLMEALKASLGKAEGDEAASAGGDGHARKGPKRVDSEEPKERKAKGERG